MRTLASIQVITALTPIPDADLIERAQVLGWGVVVKKNEFKVGDMVVYLEIDSWVPTELAPFLSKGKEPSEFEGVKGERLKTIRLKGQISQGLILPLSVLPSDAVPELFVGQDVTDALGIKKWEAPIPANLGGMVKGNFPGFLFKTDTERIQSNAALLNKYLGVTFRAHEKLDGSSCTVYSFDNDFGVCSRNLDLKETEENAFWQVARKYDLRNKLQGLNIAIQGELIGPGVQKNIYALKELDLFVFDIFDISKGEYLSVHRAKPLVESLGLKWCPYGMDYTLHENTTVEELLSFAEGKSALNPNQEREGLVWRPVVESYDLKSGRVAFKTISNKFLLKNQD